MFQRKFNKHSGERDKALILKDKGMVIKTVCYVVDSNLGVEIPSKKRGQ